MERTITLDAAVSAIQSTILTPKGQWFSQALQLVDRIPPPHSGTDAPEYQKFPIKQAAMYLDNGGCSALDFAFEIICQICTKLSGQLPGSMVYLERIIRHYGNEEEKP